MPFTLATVQLPERGVAADALCSVLSRQLGIEVVSKEYPRYAALTEALQNGEASMAWLSPLVTIELLDRGVARPIALPIRNGSATFRAALFGKYGPKRKLADLRGKRVAWVDKSSVAGYVVPRMLIANAGFDPATFFGTETFYETHERVVAAVLGELAEVGATYCRVDAEGNVVWAGWTESDGPSAARVEIPALSGPIPNDAIVLAANVPTSIETRLMAALIADPLVTGAAKKLFRADGFEPAEASHFSPLRTMLG